MVSIPEHVEYRIWTIVHYFKKRLELEEIRDVFWDAYERSLLVNGNESKLASYVNITSWM